ncbi:MAG: hypothetical protein IPK32_13595 [Verrucomicrobiaceae bacterium]|nr:hypothetical protein [Verrucomicrobiaceae bacterium]
MPQPSFADEQSDANAATTPLLNPLSRHMHLAEPEEPVPHLSDLASQMEQLRNDFFSAVTTISALSDRVERLESRLHTVQNAATTAITTLREEIGQWITHHMDAAVEQRMRAVWEKYQAQTTSNPTTV